MDEITVEGFLVCADAAQADVVARHVGEHARLSRAEPGCLSFEVLPTEDPLRFSVAERFTDAVAFAAHQERIAGSEWGRLTVGIRREYVVTGA